MVHDLHVKFSTQNLDVSEPRALQMNPKAGVITGITRSRFIGGGTDILKK
jgi:hypothetical protein